MFEIKNCFKQQPLAIFGEFGLDAIAIDTTTKKKFSIDIQRSLFDLQFKLAFELKLPVSLHCVKTWGHMIEKLSEFDASVKVVDGISVMFHSFSGSLDTIHILKKMKMAKRFFYSFSAFVNARVKEEKWMACIREIPDNAILVESDMEDVTKVERGLIEGVLMVSKAKEWTVEYTIIVLDMNAQRYLENRLE